MSCYDCKNLYKRLEDSWRVLYHSKEYKSDHTHCKSSINLIFSPWLYPRVVCILTLSIGRSLKSLILIDLVVKIKGRLSQLHFKPLEVDPGTMYILWIYPFLIMIHFHLDNVWGKMSTMWRQKSWFAICWETLPWNLMEIILEKWNGVPVFLLGKKNMILF